jgi:hypothetical protein
VRTSIIRSLCARTCLALMLRAMKALARNS